MNEAVGLALQELIAGRDVPEAMCHSAISAVMDGQCEALDIAALLTGLRVRGETVDELVGAARAMRERSLKVTTTRRGLLDTCGTGGDELRTFNISTATAIVAAACGVPVAKHGNRSVSSSSGSADVLEALGVRTNLNAEQVGRCLDEVGIGFCFAPVFHGAMRHAAPVRKALRFRTIFNLLGPLTNPANAECQLLGASRISTAEKLAHAAARLGGHRTVVVCGNDQLDEVSLWGETAVFEVVENNVSRRSWTAKTFGLPECGVENLRVDSPTASADCIRAVLSGSRGPARDIVVANVAAGLFAAEVETDLTHAAHRAAHVLDSGQAQKLLADFANWTQACPAE